jgi:hypothetical protein
LNLVADAVEDTAAGMEESATEVTDVEVVVDILITDTEDAVGDGTVTVAEAGATEATVGEAAGDTVGHIGAFIIRLTMMITVHTATAAA